MAAVSSDQSKTSESLLVSSVSKRSVLVVGDGNFSFSLSLAVFFLERGLNSTPLVVTSFDSHEKLKEDNFASSNLNELERFKNVDVLHQVDATNLCQYFPNQKFGRIIFNFPHTGGKSNIKKCRKLLEDFFSSATQCLDHEGDICVTLCKGQGGTPVDQPCRSHGNSWQIVTNAAKSGKICSVVYSIQTKNICLNVCPQMHFCRGKLEEFRWDDSVGPFPKMAPSTSLSASGDLPKPLMNTQLQLNYIGDDFNGKQTLIKQRS